MPEIAVTEEQRERLRALQRRLEEEIPSPYATVRPGDAVAYLLDQHVDGGVDPDAAAVAAGEPSGDDAEAESAGAADGGGDDPTDDAEAGGDGGGLPSGPMNLLADHGDVWREGSGEARYEVDLPDGSTAEARTKGDVRALLFEHYR